jgi:hypothetical protein
MEAIFMVVGVMFGGFFVWASQTGPVLHLPIQLWSRLVAWSYARLLARKHFERMHRITKADLGIPEPSSEQTGKRLSALLTKEVLEQ